MIRAYKRRKVLSFTAFILAALLSGCSLANPELQDIKKGDQLVGVFVTLAEDLKDYEMQSGDTLYYQEKRLVRADGSVRKLTDEEIECFNNGFTVEAIKQQDGSYKFDEINGSYLIYTGVTKKDNVYMEEQHSENIYDIKPAVSSNEWSEGNKTRWENSITLEATMAVNAKEELQVRLNKVYQRSDGSIYTVVPNSPTLCIAPVSEQALNSGSHGLSISESYEDSVKGTGISDKVNKETRNFKINIAQMDYLESAIAVQMDKSHHQVQVTAVDLTKKKQSLRLNEKTAYIIIEEHYMDIQGNPYNKRTVYDNVAIDEDDGEEDPVSHTFYRTKDTGRIELITLSFMQPK
ncbi:hypothetical protein [Aminipila sp.]|uniref:hypothetical protein n=1 Tax=Aminipila sp. TaxID=2060095 RepID=UPI0028A2D307|nr:hypothetical protein [Aminipila sp.]